MKVKVSFYAYSGESLGYKIIPVEDISPKYKHSRELNEVILKEIAFDYKEKLRDSTDTIQVETLNGRKNIERENIERFEVNKASLRDWR